MREAIAASGAPVIAVSPIIAGQAVKGPTAAMFAELGTPPSAAAAAARYGGLLQGYVMEEGDDATGIAPRVFRAATLMRTLDDKVALARAQTTVPVLGGRVGVKTARDGDRVVNVSVEFDDVAALARTTGLPVKEVLRAATVAAHTAQDPTGTPPSATVSRGEGE